MEKEQYDEAREFARALNAKRQLMSDGALLDQCQQHLNALVEHLALEFEEHPHENAVEDAPAEMPVAFQTTPSPAPEPETEARHSAPHQQHHKKAATKKHR